MKICRTIATMFIIAASFASTNVSAAIVYDYQTIFSISPGDSTPPDGIDTIVIDWNTTLNSGAVDQSDLDYLSIAFLAGPSNLYFDTAIIGGVVQNLGAAIRSASEVLFDFDLDTGLLNQFGNASVASSILAGGTRYSFGDGIAFPIDNSAIIKKFVDGSITDDTRGNIVTNQATRLLRTTSVSAPTSLVILMIGLLGLGLSRIRKT